MTVHLPLDRGARHQADVAPASSDRLDDVELRVEVVRSRERFEALAPEWDALAAQQETPLALHGWYAAALDAQGNLPLDLAIALVWREDRLVGAAPLMRTSTGPRRLVPVDAFAGEPDRILYADHSAVRALAGACARLGEPVLWRRLSVPSEDCDAFFGELRKHGPALMRRHYQTSRVNLPASFAELTASMSKSRRYAIRRKLKAIGKEGGAELEMIAPAEEMVETLLARFALIEDAGWKGRAGTSMLGDDTMARFVTQVARTFARTGDTQFCFLKIGGSDAAGRILLRNGSCWCELKIGYNEQFGKFSPGIVLMHEIFGRAAEHGIRSYDFLGVSEDWQNHWPHVRRWDYRLATYPLSPRSVGAVREDAWRLAGNLVRRWRG